MYDKCNVYLKWANLLIFSLLDDNSMSVHIPNRSAHGQLKEIKSVQVDLVVALEDILPLIQDGFIGSCLY